MIRLKPSKSTEYEEFSVLITVVCCVADLSAEVGMLTS